MRTRFSFRPAPVLALLLLSLLLCGSAFAASATLDSVVTYDAGWTTIRWSADPSYSGEYTVYLELINNGSTAQDYWRLGKTTGAMFQTSECVPGKCYRISLKDDEGNLLDEKEYWLPSAETFQDGKLKNTSVKITVEPRRYQASNGDITKVKNLSAATITDSLGKGDYYYGVRYQMKMPTLVKARTFFVTLVFESPDGYLYVDKAQDVTFDKVSGGYQTLWWNIAGTDFFSSLQHTTGIVPVGTYRVTLFWDGQWVNTTEFSVRQ